MSDLKKITPNGEICFDLSTFEYVVFDETYAFEVGRTSYQFIAEAMLDVYSSYLGKGYPTTNPKPL